MVLILNLETKMEQNKENWSEEFDKKFPWEEYEHECCITTGHHGLGPNDIKSFISSLLQSERAKLIEAVEKMRVNYNASKMVQDYSEALDHVVKILSNEKQ